MRVGADRVRRTLRATGIAALTAAITASCGGGTGPTSSGPTEQIAFQSTRLSGVFTGFRNGNQEIVRRKADGSSEVVLTDLGANDMHPSWSRIP